MSLVALRHLAADGHHGVESGHRLLKDHRDLAATDTAKSAGGQLEQVGGGGAREVDGAGGVSGVSGVGGVSGVSGVRGASGASVVQQDLAGGRCRGTEQAEDGERCGAFAGAGLSDETENFPFVEIQADAANRVGCAESDVQVADVEERGHCPIVVHWKERAYAAMGAAIRVLRNAKRIAVTNLSAGSGRILAVMDTTSRIDELNRRFGVAGVSEVLVGNGGLPKVRVTTLLASAEVYLHGAQVTLWQPAGAEEVIFLSEKSHWQDGLAIRGGIPICSPWFGEKADDPKAPSHGFVRIREWRLDGVAVEGDGTVNVICSTESDEASRRWWPHEFRMEYRIAIGKSLQLELAVTNTGNSSFEFAEALHTYLRVGDARTVMVRGLEGVTYQDKTDGNREKIQVGALTFAATTDNVYLDTRGAVEVVDPALRRTIRTEKRNSGTTVVWNPGQAGAAALADLGDDEWKSMVCVETSNIRAASVSLAPGQKHTMTAILSVASI